MIRYGWRFLKKPRQSCGRVRRALTLLVAALAFGLFQIQGSLAFGQSGGGIPSQVHPEWNVLYGHQEFAGADSMLSRSLRKLIDADAEERERVMSSVKTPAELESYQAEVRAKLHAALGEFPERTPLRARTTGVLERDGYRVEKVIFESRPRYYVTASVYVPTGSSGPYPAVFCPVGHWGSGKAFEDYQRLGMYLARRGFLVMVYDSLGQGERLQHYNAFLGRSLVDPGTSEFYVTIEHGMAGGQAIMATGSFANHMVWDGLRALDYLWERKDVDRERIACTGTSGGGLQTELLAALDERIKVSIPVCYGGCAPDTPMRRGLNIADIDALAVPRPLLMIVATGDSRSGVAGKRERHQQIARLYELSEKSERTKFLIAEGRHGYIESMRQAAYVWLSRWLLSTAPPRERLPEEFAPLETPEALFSTPTGQVKSSLGGETVASLSQAEIEQARSKQRPLRDRGQWESWRQDLREKVLSRLGLSLDPAPLQPRTLNRVDKGSYILEKVVYYSDPDVYVPSLLFLPKASGPRPGVVFVHDEGKTATGLVEGYLRPLAQAGYAVLSIDARGWGETAPSESGGSRQLSYRNFTHDAESGQFYNALRAGTTLLALRTRDVLGAVNYLQDRAEVDGGKISAIGHGMGGLLAMYAAAVDDRIRSVASAGALVSYAAIIESDLYSHRFSAFAPGILRDFDLPDVAALVAPRPLLTLNPVDQDYRAVEPTQAERAYRTAAEVYRLLGAPDRLRVGNSGHAGQIVERYKEHLAR